mgnify:CR=1 FL=1
MTELELFLIFCIVVLVFINWKVGHWLTEMVKYYKELSVEYQQAVRGWTEANERVDILLKEVRRLKNLN